MCKERGPFAAFCANGSNPIEISTSSTCTMLLSHSHKALLLLLLWMSAGDFPYTPVPTSGTNQIIPSSVYISNVMKAKAVQGVLNGNFFVFPVPLCHAQAAQLWMKEQD